MKKSKLLSTPTRLTDLSFDDLYDEDEATSLKAERLNTRKWRRLRNEAGAA